MRDPQPIGEILDGVLAQMGVAKPLQMIELTQRWEELAGETWASRSRPIGLEDGTLVVEASDGTAASLLRYQEASLVERLARALGLGVVTGVRLRVKRHRGHNA